MKGRQYREYHGTSRLDRRENPEVGTGSSTELMDGYPRATTRIPL